MPDQSTARKHNATRAERGLGERARSLSLKAPLRVLPSNEDHDARPRTRGACESERPCPWVSCRHHLYLDVNDNGTVKLNFPDREPWELAQTCSLDVADAGGATLEQVGTFLNLTRERTRQMEVRALMKAKPPVIAAGAGND